MTDEKTPSTPSPVRMVCSRCFSEDVYYDAWSQWDVAKQEWVIGPTFDFAYCTRCDGETLIEEKDV